MGGHSSKSSQSRYEVVYKGRDVFRLIEDRFHSLEQVTAAIRERGLESSNLIIGVDFSKSNEWTGARSFGGRSLHDLTQHPNPYEQAISIIGRTLHLYDDDNLIPCFGFGDVKTGDQMVFNFNKDNRPCNGFSEALQRYRQIVPHLKFAGPTSFAPIIETAMGIVGSTDGRYHILLIIADGQVTRSVDTKPGTFSLQEKATIDAIVKASKYALSIVFVGVGDGPWYTIKQFDDNIPARLFDNFQFVNFTEIVSKNIKLAKKEAAFALAALMEIPFQYQTIVEYGILSRHNENVPEVTCLPPPSGSYLPLAMESSSEQALPGGESQRSPPPESSTPPEPSVFDAVMCAAFKANRKEIAFGCGHQVCLICEDKSRVCPVCTASISVRVPLK